LPVSKEVLSLNSYLYSYPSDFGHIPVGFANSKKESSNFATTHSCTLMEFSHKIQTNKINKIYTSKCKQDTYSSHFSNLNKLAKAKEP
jgi:hypothetical protein